jgi:hypothetical protein
MVTIECFWAFGFINKCLKSWLCNCFGPCGEDLFAVRVHGKSFESPLYPVFIHRRFRTRHHERSDDSCIDSSIGWSGDWDAHGAHASKLGRGIPTWRSIGACQRHRARLGTCQSVRSTRDFSGSPRFLLGSTPGYCAWRLSRFRAGRVSGTKTLLTHPFPDYLFDLWHNLVVPFGR